MIGLDLKVIPLLARGSRYHASFQDSCVHWIYAFALMCNVTRPCDFHNVCSLVKWFAKLRYLDKTKPRRVSPKWDRLHKAALLARRCLCGGVRCKNVYVSRLFVTQSVVFGAASGRARFRTFWLR